MGLLRETFAVGPLACNCSVLVDERSRDAIVVDPGGDADAILATLQAQNATLKAMVITHAHIDHLCGIPALQEATGAPVLLHPEDGKLYTYVGMQAQLLGIKAPSLPAYEGTLRDGLSIPFGDCECGVVYTPGHTPGSVCFHLPAHKLLLAGDTLFRGSIGSTDLWGGDRSQILRSLRQLMTLAEDTCVVCGHGPETRIGDEKRHNPFLQ